MANIYSHSSLKHLLTCHYVIQFLFTRVLKGFDHSIVEGYRGEELQNRYFRDNKSKVKWPDSLHNHTTKGGKPNSLAVHALPYPIDWRDRDRFHYFAGYVKRMAEDFTIELRWGGDWKGNNLLNKNNYTKPFDDLAHWEVRL